MSPVVVVVRLRAVLAEAARWYRERLVIDRPAGAVDALWTRGMVELAANTPSGTRWGVGYAPSSPAGALLVHHLRGAGFTDAEQLESGAAVVARNGKIVDAFHGRLVVSLIDPAGEIGFTARRLVDPPPTPPTTGDPTGDPMVGTWPPMWRSTARTRLHDPRRHLIGATQQADLIDQGTGIGTVLVRGILDAVAVNLAGYIGVVAGGSRLTTAHADELRKITAATGGPLTIAYDDDHDGPAAAERAAALLTGTDLHLARLHTGLSPAALLAQIGPGGLHAVLDTARPR